MVYFIQNPLTKHIKIGSTADLPRRISELQVASSAQLRTLYTIETPEQDSLSFEKHVQEICAWYRLEGEWFREEVLDHLLAHPWYKSNMVRTRTIPLQEG